MKGRIKKTDKGWVVLYTECVPKMIVTEWNKSLPLHPYDVKQIQEDSQRFDNIEARISAYPDVEFDIVEVHNKNGQVGYRYVNYAKLINPEYPELEGTMNLCNDKIWDDIYHDYTAEQYPAFGGPFTDSISFIDWLKQNYKSPEKIK